MRADPELKELRRRLKNAKDELKALKNSLKIAKDQVPHGYAEKAASAILSNSSMSMVKQKMELTLHCLDETKGLDDFKFDVELTSSEEATLEMLLSRGGKGCIITSTPKTECSLWRSILECLEASNNIQGESFSEEDRIQKEQLFRFDLLDLLFGATVTLRQTWSFIVLKKRGAKKGRKAKGDAAADDDEGDEDDAATDDDEGDEDDAAADDDEAADDNDEAASSIDKDALGNDQKAPKRKGDFYWSGQGSRKMDFKGFASFLQNLFTLSNGFLPHLIDNCRGNSSIWQDCIKTIKTEVENELSKLSSKGNQVL